MLAFFGIIVAILSHTAVSNAVQDNDFTKKNICLLPAVKGPCEALIMRWHYNAKEKKCEKFEYGGCQGNANNFPTEEDCQRKCMSVDEICALPSQIGLCKAFFQKWYYNVNSKKCEMFVYGGCAGNANNFEEKEECEKFCSIKTCTKLALKALKSKLIGSYIPQCDENGNFKPKQCHGSTGYCWCVEKNGKEIKGTQKGPGQDLNCDQD